MIIRYFADTDTALLEFSNAEIAETREISEDIYIDLYKDGDLVSMTIEHAKKKANLAEMAYYQWHSRWRRI